MHGEDMWRERAASVQGRDKQSATDTRSVRDTSTRHALYTSAYVSIRQHTCQRRVYTARPAYVSIRQHTSQHTSACVSIRVRDASTRHALHTSAYVTAYVSIRQHTSEMRLHGTPCIRQHTSRPAYVSIRQHTSETRLHGTPCIRQHTSAYVRDASTWHALHTPAYVSIRQRPTRVASETRLCGTPCIR
jgi:hypothetical protein